MVRRVSTAGGTSSSWKMALTGQTGSQAAQSMQVSELMKYWRSSLVVWMQSTGQTSTQVASFASMQGSVMT
jgi:hypothetical protein